METDFEKACLLGVERVAAWVDLLDDINVFPVADGDTGRNLITSLTPLRYMAGDREETINQLLLSARGNSGNIAARFFSGFLGADTCKAMPRAAQHGRDLARQAVKAPVPGTMLTLFDALAEFLESQSLDRSRMFVKGIIRHLEKSVRSTRDLLPSLKQAGVVDAGALGMYIFLEGFFNSLIDRTDAFRPIRETFQGLLEIDPSFKIHDQAGYCVDVVVRSGDRVQDDIRALANLGDSVVVIPHGDYLKVHMHTHDTQAARQEMESIGDLARWSHDDIGSQIKAFKKPQVAGAIHVMTDAAGSVTREDARDLNITLLDSYILAGDRSLPETLFSPGELYEIMRGGTRVTTSQASVFERHQHYRRVIDQYERVLYLCVGSAFTGNYDTVMDWKRKYDPDHRLTVIDTGAASGRLGTIALATARYAAEAEDPEAVVRFAEKAVDACEEYVFLDKLKYLAAGGRLSKPGAFFGDMLRVKPIISPTAQGAKKVGTARNQKEQVAFALERLQKTLKRDTRALIMLEFSDNRAWVKQTLKKCFEDQFPAAEIMVQPLSLTSGVHMGPGTWGVAYLPDG